MVSIFIIDNDAGSTEAITKILEFDNHNIIYIKDLVAAFQYVNHQIQDLLIIDITPQEKNSKINSKINSLKLLELLKNKPQNLSIIIISASENNLIARTAVQSGTIIHIEKPFKEEELRNAVNTLLSAKRPLIIDKPQTLNINMQNGSSFYNKIIGSSNSINNLRNAINKISRTHSRVLIEGPKGSGKSLVATSIHQLSKYALHPFKVLYPLHFTTMPENTANNNLLLYGKEENNIITPGIIEQCSPGTLLLDEISEFPLDIQRKLTNILQKHYLTRIGGNTAIEIKTRFLSTSSKNLEYEVSTGRLSQNFYSRLNVFQIKLPPLNEHITDLPELCTYFINQISNALELPVKRISEDALSIMQAYNWAGNISELKSVLEWLLVTSKEDPIITADYLPEELVNKIQFFSGIEKKVIKLPLKQARQEFERQYLKTQLMRFSNSITKTSEFIKMERSALYRKMKVLGLK